MITVQPIKRDSTTPQDKFSRANSRKVFQAFPTNPKYEIPSSSSSESSKTSASSKPNLQQETTDPRSSVAKPNKPLTNSTLPVTCNNEVLVFDVNNTAALHSLIARNGAWFLDVNDLDAMDKETTFQYVAMRPSPYNDLVLTRVPELRHLIYVKFDEEGRPYPIQMRKVSKAKYLGKTEEIVTEEKSKEFQANNSSFWEALSVTLRRSIMFNEVQDEVKDEEPHNEGPQNDA